MRNLNLLCFVCGGVVWAQTTATSPKPMGTLAQPPDKVILTVGTEKLTVADYDQLVEALPEQYRAAARGSGKRQLLEQLISLKIMSQEGRRRKLDESPVYKRQLAFQAENLLAGTLYRDMTENIEV